MYKSAVFSAVVASALVGPFAVQAQSEFMAVCRTTGTEKSCQCMQGRIPADKMPSAIAAMKKSNASMAEGGKPLDPSTLPAAEMDGLQQVVLAQAYCM